MIILFSEAIVIFPCHSRLEPQLHTKHLCASKKFLGVKSLGKRKISTSKTTKTATITVVVAVSMTVRP